MKKLLFTTLLLWASSVMAQTLHFRQLTVKDGLPHNSVIALGEDVKGCLWIATSSGLCYWNAEQFIPISVANLPDKRVDRINRDSKGTMWVQCYEHHQQVSRYDTLTHTFTTYNAEDLPDSVRLEAVKPLNRTFADPNSSRVWNVDKRMLWQTDTLKPSEKFAYTGQIAIDAGLREETIFSLLLDSRDILWVGTADNGLVFADTRQNRYRRFVCQGNPSVRAVCKDAKGTLWFATSREGLKALPVGGKEYSPVSYPLTDSIEGLRIRPIIQDSKKRLWLGTFDGLYMKPAGSDSFEKASFMDTLSHAIYSLFEDEKHQLWIGTERGLYLADLNSKNPQPLLADGTLNHIIDINIGKDTRWVATNGGLFKLTETGNEQWCDIEAHSVVTDALGQTWVGTDDGICLATDHHLQPFPSLVDGHIVKDLQLWRDFLWCSYDQGICCINIYTGRATRLRTEYNEYMEGASCIDTQSEHIYFGGTQGIDCFSLDSLDSQLRTSRRNLWFDEVNIELSPKKEAESSNPLWLYICIILSVIIVAIMVFLISHRQKSPEVSEQEEEEKTSISSFELQAAAIVKAHMADADFTADQMAREMAMSRSKLFTLMKLHTGKAVMEFVRDIRLDYAAERLKAGTPVSEIAEACGFSDASSFRRSFVRKFGVTPSQYRVK